MNLIQNFKFILTTIEARICSHLYELFGTSDIIQLQVAEQLINPFGDDEEDFELNFLIDRHTKVNPRRNNNDFHKFRY